LGGTQRGDVVKDVSVTLVGLVGGIEMDFGG